MYVDYIRAKTDDTTEITTAMHIDILTYNRIRFDKLTTYQQDIVSNVHNRLTNFYRDNEELINSYLQNYSINGVSMSFGNSWNLMCVSGVAIPQELFSLLKTTGLCYPAI